MNKICITPASSVTLFRARPGTLKLNWERRHTDGHTICDLCKMNLIEDLHHFLMEGTSITDTRKNILGLHRPSMIKSYIQNRRARVVIDNNRSKNILLRHGVPQGGVLSPTLFIVCMNDLVKQLPTFVKSAMYADDLVMWSTEEYAATAQIWLQTATTYVQIGQMSDA